MRLRPEKMRTRSLARLAFAVLIALVVACVSRRASAQACCSGSSALTPGRLAPMEDALVGGGMKVGAIHGSWGTTGSYSGTPIGTRELDLEEDLLASIRFLKHGQATALVPFVETYRLATLRSDAGGGIGDVNLSARWDFTLAGQHDVLPGIAVLVGVTFPTGVAADQAHHALAADTTGIGAVSGNVGVAFEQTYDHLLLNLSGIVADRTERSANGVTTQLGPQIIGFLAVGWTFDDERVIALTATYTGEPDATINGQREPNSNRSSLLLGIGGGLEVVPKWRLSLSVASAPPIDNVGTNNPASATAATYLLRSF
jgi:hypothetical protein